MDQALSALSLAVDIAAGAAVAAFALVWLAARIGERLSLKSKALSPARSSA